MTVGPEELGRQLRRARHRLGLSLKDVHAITAIPLSCLAALEEGRLADLPSPVYGRGYVRSYAEAVRLDGDRLALELWRCLEDASLAAPTNGRTATARPPRPTARPALRHPSSPWVPRPGRLRRMLPGIERVAIGVLVVVLAIGIWDLEKTRPVATPKAARVTGISNSRPAEPPPTSPTTVAPSPSIGTPVADDGSLATYATGKTAFTVLVQATDATCWVDMRATPGGPSLFQTTLQPRESHPLSATGTAWVRVGNVGHVTVTVDGSPLTLPNKPSVPYNLLIRT